MALAFRDEDVGFGAFVRERVPRLLRTAPGAIERRAKGYRMVVTANDIELVARGFSLATASFSTAARNAAPAKKDTGQVVPLREAAQ